MTALDKKGCDSKALILALPRMGNGLCIISNFENGCKAMKFQRGQKFQIYQCVIFCHDTRLNRSYL